MPSVENKSKIELAIRALSHKFSYQQRVAYEGLISKIETMTSDYTELWIKSGLPYSGDHRLKQEVKHLHAMVYAKQSNFDQTDLELVNVYLNGRTALHIAAAYNPASISTLLNAGAAVNAK